MASRSETTAEAYSHGSCSTKSGRHWRHASSTAGIIAAVHSRPNSSRLTSTAASSRDALSRRSRIAALSAGSGSAPVRNGIPRSVSMCSSGGGTTARTSSPRFTQASTKGTKDADRRRGQARDEERARRLGESPRSPRPVGELPTARPAPRQQRGTRDPLEPTATRNCPHCDQPITIVALLATPEAARPSITSRVPDVTPLRRTP